MLYYSNQIVNIKINLIGISQNFLKNIEDLCISTLYPKKLNNEIVYAFLFIK